MEYIIEILNYISFVFCYFMILSSNIHIYQLNYYKDNFQFKWIKKNIKNILIKNIWLMCIIPLTFLGIAGRIISILIYIIVGFLSRIKNAKKKLVYTNRVYRLIITAYIIPLVILGIKIFNNNLILDAILPLICFIAPISIIFFNLLNKPLNKYINNRYINKAKNKINSMKNLIVIGVTGSYGKTSMKNYLYKLLSQEYNVLITPENYNTTLGVVKTISEKLKPTHDIFICEMGACNVGDIKEICDIVNPKYGVITSIGPQHLETFKNVETIVKTKFELVDSLPNESIAFLNYDNEYIRKNKTNKNKVTYGIKDNYKKDFEAYEYNVTENGIEFKVKKDNEEYIFTSKLLGEHNVTNLIGAIAVASTLGIPMKKIIYAVKQIEGVEHRLQLIKNGDVTIIDDAYNSNPAGSKSALNTLSKMNGVKILITPGMIELGEAEYKENFKFGKYAAEVCDYIILVGKNQTKPIYDGIISKKYDENKIIILEDVKLAIKEAYKINSNGNKKVILLENDLPDNY